MESSSLSSAASRLPSEMNERPPIPTNLGSLAADRHRLWRMSPGLMERVNFDEDVEGSLRKVEVLPDDPEYAFVQAYFNHQRPAGTRIKKIEYLHNPTLKKGFKAELCNSDAEAENVCFRPQWREEPQADLRERVINRWEDATGQFSPIKMKVVTRVKDLSRVKIMPVWHGTSNDVADSVSESGFASFGKHRYWGREIPGIDANVDEGYFGSGIYFTDSAKYAAMYGNKLLLCLAAMREPFPVVSDVPKGRPRDMNQLAGLEHYLAYNAHFIPVASTNPGSPDCMYYYPCIAGQRPAWDELVVFQRAQALPLFCVEFESIPGDVEPEIAPPDMDGMKDRILKACREGDNAFLRNQIQGNPVLLDACGPNSESLFHIAAKHGQLEVMAFLHGRRREFLTQETDNKEKPIYTAALAGQIGAMQWIVNRGPNEIQHRTQDGWSLLHIAAYTGHADIAHWLIDKCPALLNAQTNDNWTPAYTAAMGGKIDTLAALRDQPTWLTLLNTRAKDGSTAAHAAAFRDELETLQWLERAVPGFIEQTSRQDNTVMHWAAAGGALKVLKWLQASQPNVASKRNRRGETALHIAAAHGRNDSVKQLFPALSAVNDLNGRTALHAAVIQGRMETAKLLIELGMNSNDLTKEHENCLHFCAEYGHLDLLKEFLELHGIDKRPLFQGDSDGKLPIHKACWLHPKPEIVQTLLNAGADPNSINIFDYTPLHWAAKHGHRETAQILIGAGANIDAKNKNGDTALDLAIRWNQDEMRQFLADPSNAPPIGVEDVGPDPKEFHHDAFLLTHQDNPLRALYHLEMLGSIYAKEGHVFKASHLWNSAYHFAVKKLSQAYACRLLTRLESAEGDFLHQELNRKSPPENRGHIQRYRDEVAQIRTEVDRLVGLNQPISAVQKLVSEALQGLLTTITHDAINLLGSPPTDFAVISLGSLARKDMGPYSKLSFAILVRDPSQKHYFRNLAHLIDLSVLNLGETEHDINFSREGADPLNLAPNGISMNREGFNPLGRGIELIGTPEEFAQFQTEAWLKENPDKSMFSSTLVTPSFLLGNPALTNEYSQAVDRLFNIKTGAVLGFGGIKARETRSIELLRACFAGWTPNLSEERIDHPLFDTKKDLIDPLHKIIDALAHYHQVPSLDRRMCVQQLYKKGVITNQGHLNLLKALDSAYDLQLRVQRFYGQDKQVMMFGPEDDTFPIDQDARKKLIDVYRVQVPLYQAVENFLGGNKQAFAGSDLYHSDLGRSNLSAESESRYPDAEQKYIQTAALSPTASHLSDLARIKGLLGQAGRSRDLYIRALAILQRTYGATPHAKVADALEDLGRAYEYSKQPAEAVDCHRQALTMREQLFPEAHAEITQSKNDLAAAQAALALLHSL